MINIQNINHHYKIGKHKNEQIVPVLHNVHLQVEPGEIVTIVGRSGSGKSTLLHLLSGYLKPISGTIQINQTNVTHFSEEEWARFRLDHLGFVFQNFQLIPTLTAYDNVELPLVFRGISRHKRRAMTEEILKNVDLLDYKDYYPNELSGGQQQRVAIARALIVEPPLILADEPTGSLDSTTEQEILELIKHLNNIFGITFLIITHDHRVASIGDRKVAIEDGYLLDQVII